MYLSHKFVKLPAIAPRFLLYISQKVHIARGKTTNGLTNLLTYLGFYVAFNTEFTYLFLRHFQH